MSGWRTSRRRWAGDRSGVAALEFAIIAPLMVVCIFGVIDLLNGLRAHAKVYDAAGQLAEYVARSQSVTANGGTLADFCAGVQLDLFPFPATTLAANIASVSNDHPSNRVAGSTDSTSVHTYLDWENVSSCPAAPPGQLGLNGAFALANAPSSLLTKSGVSATGTSDPNLQMGNSAIVVRLSYSYSQFNPATLGQLWLLPAIAVARPRTNVTVTCTNPAGTAACPPVQ